MKSKTPTTPKEFAQIGAFADCDFRTVATAYSGKRRVQHKKLGEIVSAALKLGYTLPAPTETP